jgi:hypothetical protein
VEALYEQAPHHRVLWLEHGHQVFGNADAISATVAHVQDAE